MKKLDSILDKIEEILCTLFVMVMAFAILIQVINRNTVQLSFTWGEELARYCMVWLTFIGISAGVKQGSHIGVDALLNVLPANVQKGFRILVSLIVTGLYLYMTVLSVEITLGIRETRQVSPAMQVPMYIVYAGLIVGMFMSTLRSLQATADVLMDTAETDEKMSGGDAL